MSPAKFDRTIYLVGFITSAVYVFVLGFLSTRQYLCDAIGPARCPQSPFTLLHLLMHSGFFGYIFLFRRKVPRILQWKWYLLCLTVFSFIGIVFVQRYSEVNTVLVYLSALLSLTTFFIFYQEKQVMGKSNQILKIGLSIFVVISVIIFVRNIGTF